MGILSAHSKWKDLCHYNGGSKFGAPVYLRPEKGCGGLRGSSGQGEEGTQLSLWFQGTGTEAKRSHMSPPILPAPLPRLGWGRGWSVSSLGLLRANGNRDHFRREGSWGWLF